MDNLTVKRLDHLGIVSGLIRELKIIEQIDERIEPDPKETITTGEAIAAMIMNGLGFSDRPLYLTPQFFEEKPLEHLFRPGLKSEHFNRFKLGRSLDDVFEYGCDLLFSEIAKNVCKQEGVNMRNKCIDTTSFSLTGQYDKDSDTEEITITHGYSKDHRNDLKQAILELVVCKDAGIPIVCKSFSGNDSDNTIFKERCKELVEQLSPEDTTDYIIADSKLYCEKNAENLKNIGFVTRVPANIKKVSQSIENALNSNDWEQLDDTYKYQKMEVEHYSIAQRWIIVFSNEAFKQTEHTLDKAKQREHKKFSSAMYHLKAKRFDSQKKAVKALEKITDKLRYHVLETHDLHEHSKYLVKGRPKADSPKQTLWQITASIQEDPDKIQWQRNIKSCYVLATNVSENDLPDGQVLYEYKDQSHVERGFRFLKSPVFFTSSLFLKKPARIQGLLMVMTFALLIYSIAERRIRSVLKESNGTLPDQIGQPTKTPTLRWCFQMLEGINVVSFEYQGKMQILVQGITDLRKKILSLFGDFVRRFYEIPIS